MISRTSRTTLVLSLVGLVCPSLGCHQVSNQVQVHQNETCLFTIDQVSSVIDSDMKMVKSDRDIADSCAASTPPPSQPQPPRPGVDGIKASYNGWVAEISDGLTLSTPELGSDYAKVADTASALQRYVVTYCGVKIPSDTKDTDLQQAEIQGHNPAFVGQRIFDSFKGCDGTVRDAASRYLASAYKW